MQPTKSNTYIIYSDKKLMGRILNLKSQSDEKINVTLELTTKEVLWLKGNLDKMHLFSENNLEFESRLVQRGIRESTK